MSIDEILYLILSVNKKLDYLSNILFEINGIGYCVNIFWKLSK